MVARSTLPKARRRLSAGLLVAAGCLALSGCATAPSQDSRAFRVVWSASRASDHTVLAASSLLVRPGAGSRQQTDSTKPSEEKPAFPTFAAHLTPVRNTGVYDLVTKIDVREAHRSKKGKLKITKRSIGAFVPARIGQTQLVSPESDPIHLEVRLERP